MLPPDLSLSLPLSVRCKIKTLKREWLLSNNIVYFFSCFIHYLENKTHWINTNLESDRFSPYSHSNMWLFLQSSLGTSGRIQVAESTLKQTWATHCNETLKTGMQMLKWSPYTDTEKMDWHTDKTFRTSRNTRGEKKHLYTQRINKEKLGPRQLYCTDTSIRRNRLLSLLPSGNFQSSTLPVIKFKYSTVRHDVGGSLTVDCTIYRHAQNINQWLASTVVPFRCECS